MPTILYNWWLLWDFSHFPLTIQGKSQLENSFSKLFTKNEIVFRIPSLFRSVSTTSANFALIAYKQCMTYASSTWFCEANSHTRSRTRTYAHKQPHLFTHTHTYARAEAERKLKIYEDAKVSAVRFDCFQSYLLWSAESGEAKWLPKM